MDVVTAEQAKIAEDAGAVAVMALERVPADIRAQGGVSRMSDPDMIDGIIEAVSIPVMAKARIGHFAEAQVLQSLGRRLHRRVRGADPGRLRQPHRQVAVHRAVRLRRDQPRRGAAPHHRGCGDDPLQGRGRHRRRLQRGHPHAHDRRRAAAAPRPQRGRAVRRGQGAAGAVRPGPRGRRGRQAAGRAVHRRRHRHPGRRRDDDAARAPRASSSARASSSPATPPSAPRRSSRPPRSTTTPTWSPRSAAASARPWSASTSTRSRSRTGWPSAAGSRARTPMSPTHRRLRPAGRRPRAPARARRRSARRAIGVRRPAELDAVRRAGHPRRRVDHDVQAGPHLRPVRAAPAADQGGHAGLRHLRRDDHARRPDRGRHAPTRRRSAGSTSPSAATPSAARSTPSRATSTSPGSTTRCTPCSSGRRGSRQVGPDVEVLARIDDARRGRPPVGSSRSGRAR